MKSKLLHAIVGVGMSLGGATGCFAQVDDGGGGNDGSGGGPTGSGGATASDAGVDAIDWDAFCDTPWPITKANTADPPTCADRIACASAERPPVCLQQLGPHHCTYDYVSVICQDGDWACPAGTLRREECACWGDIGQDAVCTEAGPVPSDGGG